MTRRLGAWDCPYCTTKRLLGNVFECPNCAHPRPRGIYFYEIDDGPIVTPEIQAQLGSGGPNWYCEYCDSGNRDTDNVCWKCQAARDDDAPVHKVTNYTAEERPFDAEAARTIEGEDSWRFPETSMLRAPHGQPDESETPVAHVSYQHLSEDGYGRNRTILAVLAIVLVPVLLVLFYNFFFNTHTEQVTAVGFEWRRNVVVEEYQVVHETSWSSHPTSAYNIQESYRDTGHDRKVHDRWETEYYMGTCYKTESYSSTCYRTVYDNRTCTGSRSNGDGSFDSYTYECGSSSTESYSCTDYRQVPYSCQQSRQKEIYHYEDVYDYFYEYDIKKWIEIEDHPTQGRDQQPYYADLTLVNPYQVEWLK
jgi:hypothetical protein